MLCLKRFALLALLLMLLSACSMMDISSQSTAVPLAPKSFEIGAYRGTGVELKSMVDSNSDLDEESRSAKGGWYVFGLKYALSASPEVDFVGRIYLSGCLGGKLGLKYLIKQKGDHYLSIVPAVTWMRGVSDYKYSDSETSYSVHKEYVSTGIENQLLSSWVLGKESMATIGGRINISRFSRPEGDGPYTLVHGGVFGNMRFGSNSIFLMPEVGVEFVPVIDGEFSLVPNLSLGLGFAF